METEKLFYEDVLLREFDARVLSCERGKKSWEVILDRTAFYPEGGGQPADHGFIGNVEVTDVHEKDGAVIHYCVSEIPADSVCHCTLDWERRFDHMQQHSGEHIVSGMICEKFSCDNVGFHMGSDSILIDYNADITDEELQEIEDRANRYIWEDHPFLQEWPSPEELEVLEFRSKKALSGKVRITRFSGADCCACCGTHVPRSGMAGPVKFLSKQRFHEGVRLELLCGERALRYLSESARQNQNIGKQLSARWNETAAAVERQSTELAEEKLRANLNEEKYFELFAKQFEGQQDVLYVSEPLSSDGTRKLCDAIASVSNGRTIVFAGSGETFRYCVIQHDDMELRETVKRINSSLNGRGGGRGGLAQGNVSCSRQQILDLFSE